MYVVIDIGVEFGFLFIELWYIHVSLLLTIILKKSNELIQTVTKYFEMAMQSLNIPVHIIPFLIIKEL